VAGIVAAAPKVRHIAVVEMKTEALPCFGTIADSPLSHPNKKNN